MPRQRARIWTQTHTRGVKSFWRLVKRGNHATLHGSSPEHRNRYVQEFAGCQNVRESDTVDQMAGLLAGMVGKRLRYPQFIAKNGLRFGARPAFQR